jgi:hypothetical protein
MLLATACSTFSPLAPPEGAGPDVSADGGTGDAESNGGAISSLVVSRDVVGLGTADVVNDIAVTMGPSEPIVAVALQDRVAFHGRQARSTLTMDGSPLEVAIRRVGSRLLTTVVDDTGSSRLQIGDVDGSGMVEIDTGGGELYTPVITGDGARFGDPADIVPQHFQTEAGGRLSTFNADESPTPAQQIFRDAPVSLDIRDRERLADADDGRWVAFRGMNSINVWDAVQPDFDRSDEEDLDSEPARTLPLPTTSEKIVRPGLARVASRVWVVVVYPTAREIESDDPAEMEIRSEFLTPFFYDEREDGNGVVLLESQGEGPSVRLEELVDMAATGMPGMVHVVWTDGSTIELLRFEGEDTDANALPAELVYVAEPGVEIREVELSGGEQDLALAWHEVDEDGVHRVGRATIEGS